MTLWSKWIVFAVQVHEATIEAGAYPSPLNYYNFPKSVCTSVNEVGIGSTHLETPQRWKLKRALTC